MEVALQETNSDQQTILHLALLHRMPDKIILLIVRFMKLEDINKRDSTNRCALDYLVSKTIKAYTLKVDQCECNLTYFTLSHACSETSNCDYIPPNLMLLLLSVFSCVWVYVSFVSYFRFDG